jgi:hypothetical protein
MVVRYYLSRTRQSQQCVSGREGRAVHQIDHANALTANQSKNPDKRTPRLEQPATHVDHADGTPVKRAWQFANAGVRREGSDTVRRKPIGHARD